MAFVNVRLYSEKEKVTRPDVFNEHKDHVADHVVLG